jgi:hypothetical protein
MVAARYQASRYDQVMTPLREVTGSAPGALTCSSTTPTSTTARNISQKPKPGGTRMRRRLTSSASMNPAATKATKLLTPRIHHSG